MTSTVAGRIGEMKRYSMPLLVGSLRKASMMVLSMEARAFGAFPHRTFVDAPRMSAAGVAVCALTLVAVAAWYTALAAGLVHTMYVLAPR